MDIFNRINITSLILASLVFLLSSCFENESLVLNDNPLNDPEKSNENSEQNQNISNANDTISINNGSIIDTIVNVSIKDQLAPVISVFKSSAYKISIGGKVQISVQAENPVDGELFYKWNTYGIVKGEGKTITWIAPEGPPCCATGLFDVIVTVSNEKLVATSDTLQIEVIL